MSVRLNWDGPLASFNYYDVARYFAAFHAISDQDPNCVLTKQEYIARAEAAYDKLGPADAETDAFRWEDGLLDLPDELMWTSLKKVGDDRSQRRTPTIAVMMGHCGMFVWSDYAEDGEYVDFS